jgi:hypothetical protein
VNSTTSARLRSRRSTSLTTTPKSVSTSVGDSGAIAETNCHSRVRLPGLATAARTAVSTASRSTRSPARAASIDSSSAASIAASRRGSSPIRAAEVRPVSSTHSTRRSRSGRQLRTTTSERRALARQSIDRTSSPMTYSRRASNSVPCPRPRVTTAPSRMRSRDSFSGSSRRDSNRGYTRRVHAGVRAAAVRARDCRYAKPSGP